jgi:glucose-1-phosphate adenylyltransferase
LAAVEHPLQHARHFGVLDVDHDFKVTGFQEKPAAPRSVPHRPDTALVSMGVYVFNPKCLVDALRACCGQGFGFDFGRDIIPSLIGSARVSAYDFIDETGRPGYWRDIGTLDSFHSANMDLAGPQPPFDPYESTAVLLYGRRERASAGALYGSVFHSVISPGVQIEKGAEVESSVLMPDVQIGQGARIRRAIIEEGVHIPAGFNIGWDLDHDRKQYAVSPGGVVVVSRTPIVSKPFVSSIAGQIARRAVKHAAEAAA